MTAKRAIVPTRAGHPTGSFLARGLYLLAAILGALFLTGAVIWTWMEARTRGLELWEQDPLAYLLSLIHI